jgi:hypothetical protein
MGRVWQTRVCEMGHHGGHAHEAGSGRASVQAAVAMAVGRLSFVWTQNRGDGESHAAICDRVAIYSELTSQKPTSGLESNLHCSACIYNTQARVVLICCVLVLAAVVVATERFVCCFVP